MVPRTVVAAAAAAMRGRIRALKKSPPRQRPSSLLCLLEFFSLVIGFDTAWKDVVSFIVFFLIRMISLISDMSYAREWMEEPWFFSPKKEENMKKCCLVFFFFSLKKPPNSRLLYRGNITVRLCRHFLFINHGGSVARSGPYQMPLAKKFSIFAGDSALSGINDVMRIPWCFHHLRICCSKNIFHNFVRRKD